VDLVPGEVLFAEIVVVVGVVANDVKRQRRQLARRRLLIGIVLAVGVG